MYCTDTDHHIKYISSSLKNEASHKQNAIKHSQALQKVKGSSLLYVIINTFPKRTQNNVVGNTIKLNNYLKVYRQTIQIKLRNNQVTMFSLQPVFKSSLALLIFLVLLTSVVVAQQQDVLMTSDDNNTDSSSLLMTNYNALREEGQGFYLRDAIKLFEKPGSIKVSIGGLYWLCDLEFSSDDTDTTNYGYVGRGVKYFFGSTLEDSIAQGAQSFPGKKRALSISAGLVCTLGFFEGQ